jgi:hypothetical protein
MSFLLRDETLELESNRTLQRGGLHRCQHPFLGEEVLEVRSAISEKYAPRSASGLTISCGPP